MARAVQPVPVRTRAARTGSATRTGSAAAHPLLLRRRHLQMSPRCRLRRHLSPRCRLRRQTSPRCQLHPRTRPRAASCTRGRAAAYRACTGRRAPRCHQRHGRRARRCHQRRQQPRWSPALPLAPALLFAPEAPAEPALPLAPALFAPEAPAEPALPLAPHAVSAVHPKRRHYALAPAPLAPALLAPAVPVLPAADAPPPPLPSDDESSELEAQLSTKPMHTDTDSNPRSERYSIRTDYHWHHATPAKPWSNSEIYYQDHSPTARSESIAPTRGERYAMPMLSTSKS